MGLDEDAMDVIYEKKTTKMVWAGNKKQRPEIKKTESSPREKLRRLQRNDIDETITRRVDIDNGRTENNGIPG